MHIGTLIHYTFKVERKEKGRQGEKDGRVRVKEKRRKRERVKEKS